ncbi:hypothetical protein [Streptomyces sp. NPDC007369]|uniref:hypothetical protein n=1 Tax=Streptomyces sp. NPDC007369 TaxID=3154589 RepID=UPI003411794F
MTATAPDRLPHQAYAEAAAGLDGPYAPDRWGAGRCPVDGRLRLSLEYVRQLPVTRQSAAGPVVVEPVLGEEAWPYGMSLRWDEVDGRAYEGAVDGRTRVYEALPVPRLASPAALRALLPPVLADRLPPLSAPAEERREPREAARRHPCRALAMGPGFPGWAAYVTPAVFSALWPRSYRRVNLTATRTRPAW